MSSQAVFRQLYCMPLQVIRRNLHCSPRRCFDIEITTTAAEPGSYFVHMTLPSSKSVVIADSDSMIRLTSKMKILEQDPGIRGLFFRSTIAGADIHELNSLSTTSQAQRFIKTVDDLCTTIQDFRVPVIAVVEKACFGAGMEIAAACDIRIATEEAKFGMPETKLGIPSVVQASLIPGLVGWGRARELLYFGESISADEAYKWGFVNSVVKSSDIDNAVKHWETRFLAVGPRAVESQKKLMRIWEEEGVGRGGIDASIKAFGNAFESSEPHKLMKKFFHAKKESRKR